MKEIETAKYHFITEINEPIPNLLEFKLICGMLSDIEEDLVIAENHVGPVRRILMNNDLKFIVRFNSYIGYSILDESYANKLGEFYTGINPRIYSKSDFLNYMKKAAFADKDYPGDYKHYAFLSENHIINVASEFEPEITKI